MKSYYILAPIMKNQILSIFVLCFVSISLFIRCNQKPKDIIQPDVITEKVNHDTDDPAIWYNEKQPEKSIIFGTDKDTDGAIYAFDLNGKILEEKTIRGLKRPNNVDIEYDFPTSDSTSTDILVVTEREQQQVRLFSVPDMQALDNGGFSVFSDVKKADYNLPMGIAMYRSPKDNSFYFIVSRKEGPETNYLHQYKISLDSQGQVSAELVRKFGNFSGKDEIEAVAVDDELGYIYYSDEGYCIRKYYAEPDMGNEEIDCFGGKYFQEDIEGIAIARNPDGSGYLMISDQQNAGSFNLFDRKDNTFIKTHYLGTQETDGCDIITKPLNATFPKGIFVAMNNAKDFYYYDITSFDVEKTGK